LRPQRLFTHALSGQYSVWVAFLEPGDEVILFEPYFDQYLPSITFNHGVPVYVPLHPPTDFRGGSTSDDWTIDFDELRRAITPKTKMIVVNTPHNPVGKVFTQEELQKIADLAIEHNIMIMSDEVVSRNPYHMRWIILIHINSTIVSSSTINPMFALQIYQACGSVQ
jgi:aspartate/methionine/tyrosine aminotransferase